MCRGLESMDSVVLDSALDVNLGVDAGGGRR